MLYAVPWFAVAGWVANAESKAGVGKLILSVFWGIVSTAVFFFALSLSTAAFPINFVGLVVAYIIGTAVAVSPFIALWRLGKRLLGKADRTPASLSATAKETLAISRRLANGTPSDSMPRDQLVRTMLLMAGHQDVTDREITLCLWPDRTALAVAEGFFEAGGSFVRLQRDDVRTKWSAASAYNAVKTALLLAMADDVTPAQHALAVAWNAELGGEAFKTMYGASKDDIAEMRERDDEDPVSTYVAAIYLRGLLREDRIDRYFPSEADAGRAVADAARCINLARADLVRLAAQN